MSEPLYDKAADGSIVLRVHVQPAAGRTAVSGRHGDALKVRVAAPPADGRANQAVIDLLAESLGVKAAQVELAGGESSREKRFKVTGLEIEDLDHRLDELVAQATTAPGQTPAQAKRQRR